MGVRVRLSADDRYPDYFATQDIEDKHTHGPVVEMSASEWAAYTMACEEYGKWQQHLASDEWRAAHSADAT